MDADTTTAAYPPPVDQLLALGRPEPSYAAQWPDYGGEYGLGPDDIPALMRLATDARLNASGDEADPAIWAPIHAWRALGQLRAEAAIAPLRSLFDDVSDEWVTEELPRAFGLIGAAAIPALTDFLADTSRDEFARANAANALVAIAQAHPEGAEAAIDALIHQLEAYAANGEELNSFLISDLTDLKAANALPLIQQVLAEDYSDPSVIAWDDVQLEFGLITREEYAVAREAHRAAPLAEARAAIPADAGTPRPGHHGGSPAAAKAKAKRKMAKESRKKNRKHK